MAITGSCNRHLILDPAYTPAISVTFDMTDARVRSLNTNERYRNANFNERLK